MVKILRLKSRDKICGNKVSFTHIKKAIDVAEKHNKNVYECPCCFCFHLTSRDNWKEEFVSFELFDKMRIEYTGFLSLFEAITAEGGCGFLCGRHFGFSCDLLYLQNYFIELFWNIYDYQLFQ